MLCVIFKLIRNLTRINPSLKDHKWVLSQATYVGVVLGERVAVQWCQGVLNREVLFYRTPYLGPKASSIERFPSIG